MVLMSSVSTSLVDLIGSAIDMILNEADHEGWAPGIVLSGGLDSSTVAAVAETVQPDIPTFTGYYDMPGYDERRYAHLAKHAEHHDILITPQDFVENFDDMREHLRPPIMGMGTFGQYMVAKYLANERINVALSGEGSDELFGGYARQMAVAGHPLPEGYENYQLPADYPADSYAAALQYDYDRLPDLLAVDDQMMSAWGLHARAPFTDQRIVDYGLALPVGERVAKNHLRSAVRGIVPDAIIDRTDKMGFPSPLVTWAQEEPVRSFVLGRLGYLPNPEKPWDRKWWVEMCSNAR